MIERTAKGKKIKARIHLVFNKAQPLNLSRYNTHPVHPGRKILNRLDFRNLDSLNQTVHPSLTACVLPSIRKGKTGNGNLSHLKCKISFFVKFKIFTLKTSSNKAS